MGETGDTPPPPPDAQHFETPPSVGCHPNRKIESPPFPSSTTISRVITDHIFDKFQTNFTKNLFTKKTYLKKFIGIKSLNTKQCPARLSPIIIPPALYPPPKIHPLLILLCCPH